MSCSTKKAIFFGGIVVGLLAVLGVILYFVLRGNDETGTDSPVVTIEQGRLLGEWVDGPTGDGFKYAAFRWIPYAEPPVGSLRFKDPQPAGKWNGTRNATTEGNVCNQISDSAALLGSEDCLYLNVYTPSLPSEDTSTLLPVLFFVHGGSFVSGSSSISYYGPDFLVTQDIVVVTINYRLSVFGFLNFENEKIPGNVALKDMILALKWVKSNIAEFGGDSSKVTIHGQSAGAACVHWLTLVPAAAGLFRAAILESGSALQGWGYTERHIEFAESLKSFILSQNATATINDLSDSLMTMTPEVMLLSALYVNSLRDPLEPGSNVTVKTTPSPQRVSASQLGVEPLIPRDPESLLLQPLTADVPILTGMSTREWLIFWYVYQDNTDPATVETQIKDLINLVPQSMIPYSDTQKLLNIESEVATYNYTSIAEYLQESIFSNSSSSDENSTLLKLYEDKIFVENDLTRMVRLRAKRANTTTYLYRFAVKSDYNYPVPGALASESNATVHGDEMNYLWHYEQGTTQEFNGNGVASQTLRRVVKMWANFVKYLDPVPDTTSDPDLTTKWNPYNKESSTDTFLNIGEELTMQEEDVGGDGMTLWMQLYKKYRDDQSI